MKKRMCQSTVWFVVVVLLLVIAHEGLMRAAASGNAAVAIFSAGRHTPVGALLLAGSLLVVRLTLFLIVPGAAAARVVLWVADRLAPRRDEAGKA